MYKVIITLLIMLLSRIVVGQSAHDFAYYNNETYKLYTDKNWVELIPLAKEGLEAGHDFYYMRMRLGIALFNEAKYTPAIKQFKKALEFDGESADANYFLHYCYIYLGRKKEAIKYYDIQAEKSKFFSSMYFEPGVKISNNNASVRNVNYIFLGLNHDFGKSVSLFHGYQRLKSNFATTITLTGNGYGQGVQTYTYDYNYSVFQNEYYASLSFLVAKGFYITPAYHIQGVKVEGYSGTNQVLSLQLAKWLGKVKVYGGYYSSKINDLDQIQIEGGLFIYPMGNTNLFLQAQATSHIENSINTMVWHGKGGIKLFPKTWLNLSYATGDMLNYSESNGYLVYNQLDVIKSKWGISMDQYLGKHLLYLAYFHENKEEYLTQIPFVHHDIVLGFNLTF